MWEAICPSSKTRRATSLNEKNTVLEQKHEVVVSSDLRMREEIWTRKEEERMMGGEAGEAERRGREKARTIIASCFISAPERRFPQRKGRRYGKRGGGRTTIASSLPLAPCSTGCRLSGSPCSLSNPRGSRHPSAPPTPCTLRFLCICEEKGEEKGGSDVGVPTTTATASATAAAAATAATANAHCRPLPLPNNT